MAGSVSESDDGRAAFAESNADFTKENLQMIVSELPASIGGLYHIRKNSKKDSSIDRCIGCYFSSEFF